MAVWDVARFEADAIVVTDGQSYVRCQVDDGKAVWNKENKKLPSYIRDRVTMMAKTRKYLTCNKNNCVHHEFSVRGGVSNVCGLRNFKSHIEKGEIQANMGFWHGMQEAACSKFEHAISRM
jgi:hypothetical protein